MQKISIPPPWKGPPTPLEIPILADIHFFKFFSLTEPPHPQEVSIPSVGGVWIFSGTAYLPIYMYLSVFLVCKFF